MKKLARKNAPEPRVESPYFINARLLAEAFLDLAHRYRHPRQRARLVEFMVGCSCGDCNCFDHAYGFNLAYALPPALDPRPNSLLDWQSDRVWGLLDLSRELKKLAEPGEGGGGDE
jgi:hypothetical protein